MRLLWEEEDLRKYKEKPLKKYCTLNDFTESLVFDRLLELVDQCS